MPSLPPVILYRYDASPFSVKIDNVLLIKNIPHKRVNVSMTLPRPEITDYLGISYRRIPILAIGNDVYCDTTLIASALERRFPAAAGYGTLFPLSKHGASADTVLIKAIARYYFENTFFPLATTFLPWDKMPKEFVGDRSLFFGRPIDPNHIISQRQNAVSTFSAHLLLIEEHLKDGRLWLFDTELPSLADVSLHFLVSWLRTLRHAKPIFEGHRFPFIIKWADRMTGFLKKKRVEQAEPEVISAAEAASCLASSQHDAPLVFDNTEAERLGLRHQVIVQVAPVDTASNYPTVGTLVGLDLEEIVIEVRGARGQFHCHFPRLGFKIRAMGSKL